MFCIATCGLSPSEMAFPITGHGNGPGIFGLSAKYFMIIRKTSITVSPSRISVWISAKSWAEFSNSIIRLGKFRAPKMLALLWTNIVKARMLSKAAGERRLQSVIGTNFSVCNDAQSHNVPRVADRQQQCNTRFEVRLPQHLNKSLPLNSTIPASKQYHTNTFKFHTRKGRGAYVPCQRTKCRSAQS